jgi:hypothetical protein
MNVLAATWHCSEQGHAGIPTVQCPKERNWAHTGLRFALLLMLLGQIIPFTAVRASAQILELPRHSTRRCRGNRRPQLRAPFSTS